MTSLKVALIGCSNIAHKHAAALSRLDDLQLVAACDLVEERARKLGDTFGVPWYTDFDEMLGKVDTDVVSVLVPSGDHARIALKLVPYGKHLVVEKPLALRIEDADEMIRACDERGVKLFEVKQNRFNRAAQKLQEAVRAGRFGRMVMGTVRLRWCRRQSYYDSAPWRGTWAMDGGVLINQASHHIDLLLWLMGEVDSVMAMTATRLSRMEAEDTGTALLRFRSGALGVVEATTATRPCDWEGSLSLLGEGGSAELGGFAMDVLTRWKFEKPLPEDEHVLEAYGRNPPDLGWSHGEFYRDVAAAIRQDRRGLVDGLEGRRTLETVSAIYEAAETGREIPLRFRPRACRLGEDNSR